MPDTQQQRNWIVAIIAVTAIVGAVVTAGVTSSVPHDLIGIASVLAGYLVGYGHGVTRAAALEGASAKKNDRPPE